MLPFLVFPDHAVVPLHEGAVPLVHAHGLGLAVEVLVDQALEAPHARNGRRDDDEGRRALPGHPTAPLPRPRRRAVITNNAPRPLCCSPGCRRPAVFPDQDFHPPGPGPVLRPAGAWRRRGGAGRRLDGGAMECCPAVVVARPGARPDRGPRERRSRRTGSWRRRTRASIKGSVHEPQ